MRNIRLRISYQGAPFCGWQRQAELLSVEGLLTQAIQKMHCRPVKIYAAGRTDSGVHASAQVVNFHSELRLPASRFVEALNAMLPYTIRVLSGEEVNPDFHARHSACARVYLYRILNQPHADSRLYQYSWYVRRPLDLDDLNRCIRPIIGEHDFTTFAAIGSQAVHHVRRIMAASFYADGYFLVLRLVGNAFLWHMVRSLVGTCVDLCKKGRADELQHLLDARQRNLAGPTAPARGLTLEQVIYPPAEAV